jgi:hypothetical protein
MPTHVEITATYAADPDTLFASALSFSEMTEAMAGLATYQGLPESGTAQEGDVIIVDVTFWGLFKQKGHRMMIERLDRANRIIQSRESGPSARQWDHHLSIQPEGDLARWTDHIVIDAGWRTPFVARFALYIYGRRHRHRKALRMTRRILTH